MSQLSNLVVSRVTFPFTNLLMNRRGIRSAYNRGIETERASADQLAALQLARLKCQISYAHRWVPWYQRVFRKIGLDPRDIRSLEDFKRIPPLTREEVIDHHMEMVDVRHRAAASAAATSGRDAGQPIPLALLRRHRLVRNNSSGSTGAPTVFFEDGSVTALNWALEARLKRWFGVGLGAREARMVRLSTVYSANSVGNQWRRRLWHQLILPGVNLRDPDYQLCQRLLNNFEPEVIMGFTGAITGLADYLKRKGERLAFRPKVVFGWAAPVYDHEKSLLEEIFDCPATNIYGSREVGHIALQCPNGQFHVNQEHMVLETDGVGDGNYPEGAGEILATTLVRTPMPFIRYRMGDIARISSTRCACGRTLQVLEEFVGRTGEIFTTRDGRMIPPNFWCRLFMAKEIPGAVRRFQVTYTKEKDIIVSIVRGSGFSTSTQQYLNSVLERNLGSATRFQLEYLDEIKPSVSGKYQMVRRAS
jgi:phenylacetate-CoA ligase